MRDLSSVTALRVSSCVMHDTMLRCWHPVQRHAYRLSRSRLPSFWGPSLRWLAETASCRRGAGSGSAVLTARSSDKACFATLLWHVHQPTTRGGPDGQDGNVLQHSMQAAGTNSVDTYVTLAASIHHHLSAVSLLAKRIRKRPFSEMRAHLGGCCAGPAARRSAEAGAV